MRIVVESSARLHMGFYNFLSDGIAYGGIGLAIDKPKVIVKVFKSDRLVIDNKTSIDVEDAVERVATAFNFKGFGVEVVEAIPRHIGLGSTTQLTLSIGYAVTKLLNMNIGVRELAVMLGRGRDSGIGIATFQYGGFIVDSGRRVSEKGIVEPPKNVDDLPQVIFRARVPRSWSILVFIPKRRRGLDENVERVAMDSPQPLPKDLQHELYKLLLLHIIPSVIRGDAETFGKAITKMQFIVGQYFSKFQGGIFCCEETEYIVNSLLSHGACGAGQSSWGPTAYGIVENSLRARRILRKVLSDIEKKGYEVEFFIAKARNRGALVREET